MPIAKPRGPAPKPDSQRRRVQKPKSYGAAEPLVAGQAAKQPTLGFKPHELIAGMWKALAVSVESQFYSEADWQRARLEMFYAKRLLTGELRLTSVAWNAVQKGLNEMLVSPADKRRAGITLSRSAVDVDAVAADAQIAEYRQRLKSV